MLKSRRPIWFVWLGCFIITAQVACSSATVQETAELAGAANHGRSDSLPPVWRLRLPKEEKLVFHGVADFDNVGTSGGQMLYPAPNVVGAFAALITHGVMVNSSKNRQYEQIIKAADKVLIPYREILDKFRHTELLRRSIGKMTTTTVDKALLSSSESQSINTWVVVSEPVFWLTQDQRALVLDNAITVQAPGGKLAEDYKNTVRVVSHAISDDPISYWGGQEGERLKDESAALLAESLDAALAGMRTRPEGTNFPYKTIRYYEGSTKKVERAQLIGASCHRLVLRTLRGDLMIVPAESGDTNCAQRPASSRQEG